MINGRSSGDSAKAGCPNGGGQASQLRIGTCPPCMRQWLGCHFHSPPHHLLQSNGALELRCNWEPTYVYVIFGERSL